MQNKTYRYLGGAITCEVIATLSLEPALTHVAFWPIVVAGYVGAFFFLSRTLRAGMGLGVAYGLWSAIGVALTAIAATALFQDPLSPIAAFGVALIVVGVYLVQA
ncbi:QacE family quaternary ammonium compound efflux SMR transporter [Corynebacterium hindlerae]|uniref:DMT family transporter n=1 Tax=Corynebacterium hindlerae TaxID=699041 RepID=UPI001AD61214|nr:SMR family transporter [Corynebacterium hindlerae]QTH59736.1 QacE family quaternary ammonium compound efflux SMR transporter [Corynebacterium hindlerae]